MGIGQLMKDLRDKGWVPRGYNEVAHTVYNKSHNIIGLYKEGKEFLILVYKKSLRDLCSKESGLWQFVCENGMIKTYENIEHESRRHSDKNHTPVGAFDNQSYYWLIESALCDEDKLEEFLLKNIKIEG